MPLENEKIEVAEEKETEMPNVEELLKILLDVNLEQNRQTVHLLMNYMNDIEENFFSVLEELDTVKAQLAQVQQIPQTKEVRHTLSDLIQNLQGQANHLQEQIHGMKTRLNEKAAQLVQNFKDQGVTALNHVCEFLGVKESLTQIRESLLQSAKEMQSSMDIARFPEMKVWDRETKALESQKIAENYDKDCRELAADIDKFSEEYDTYEYWDAVDDREENVSRIYCDLQSGDAGYIREWLQGVIDEGEPVEDVKAAKAFVNRIDDLAERREKNPLTKVEELEEANYNQIDGVLNNIKPEKQEKSDTKGMSIMEKLALNKERVAQADKPAKEPEKKPERSMDK